MRAFACPHCHALVFFENSLCVTCGSALAYAPQLGDLVLLTGDSEFVRCANAEIAVCNWVAEPGEPLCRSCALTRVRPSDSDESMPAFARTETAKRRLLYQLDFLGLPVTPRTEDPDLGLAFDLLSSAQGPITTGHQDGVITIDLAEGDDPHREAMRVSLDEPYRTLLGHLRHEIGHWYWALLVDGPRTDSFRRVFGDERADYGSALSDHYGGTGEDWHERHVSAYAASHPWEDWAETFAQYLHIRDTLQTAAAYGMKVAGPDIYLETGAPLWANPSEEPDDFLDLVATWLPLTFALNAVNRSMGKDDLYPYVLTPTVLGKVRFVHDVVQSSSVPTAASPVG